MTTAETKIGTSTNGSSQERPGTSVRTIRKASIAPRGTAMTAMPAAISSVVPNAVQKSPSANTKR